MLKENKGITLVALVVTIIVLLILAGVSIAMITGNEGILGKAKKAQNSSGALRDAISLGYSQMLLHYEGAIKTDAQFTDSINGFVKAVQDNYTAGTITNSGSISDGNGIITFTDNKGTTDDTSDDAVLKVNVSNYIITDIS